MGDIFSALQNSVMSAGPWGPIVYVLGMIVAIVISPIPSTPLIVFAGAVFGSWWGAVWSWIGAFVGAMIAFSIARLFGRPLVVKLVSPEKLARTEELFSGKHIAWMVFFLRFLPLPFFDAISYAAGLTHITRRHFIIATAFGLVPLILLFSYFGGVLSSDPLYAIIGAAIAAIVIFTLFIGIVRKKKKNLDGIQ